MIWFLCFIKVPVDDSKDITWAYIVIGVVGSVIVLSTLAVLLHKVTGNIQTKLLTYYSFFSTK